MAPKDDELLQTIKTLRDEIRVRIHLAGMDARNAFARLEDQAEHLVGGSTRKALGDLIEQLKRLRHSIPTGGHA